MSVFENLVPLDELKVKVIVDNESDTMSCGLSNIDGFEYVNEKCSQSKAGVAGNMGMCSAGHGLSLLLEATKGEEAHTLLFDAGPDPILWSTNAQKMGIDVAEIETVVLSHYHWDHSGGLMGGVIRKKSDRGNTPLLVDLHKDAIVSRGRPFPNGSVSAHTPDNPTGEELTGLGVTVQLHDKEHTVCNDFFYVSGYVPRKVPYEQGIPNHVTLRGDNWVPDEEIADERYIACHVRGRGIVVFSACSHSGIVNVCRDVFSKSSINLPIFGIVGGLHLAGAAVQDRIYETVSDLVELRPRVVLAGHCTGWRAKAHLATNMPEQFQPVAVGGTYIFRAPAY